METQLTKELIHRAYELDVQAKKAKAEADLAKNEIEKIMRKEKIRTIVQDGIQVTLGADTSTMEFDFTKFKHANPKVVEQLMEQYSDCQRVSNRKGVLRFTK